MHHNDALDAVQEAMARLVARYQGRSWEEWRPLFYRVLHSRIVIGCWCIGRHSRPDIMRMLPDAGANAGARDQNGRLPIDLVPEYSPPRSEDACDILPRKWVWRHDCFLDKKAAPARFIRRADKSCGKSEPLRPRRNYEEPANRPFGA